MDAGANNYELAENSPCINAGSLLSWMTSESTDLAGNPRLSGIVDMGAYEFKMPLGTTIIIQ